MDAPYSHAAPVEQPGSVREIAARLFPAYRVDGGTVHLAGCRLEDRWFLRAQVYHAGQHQTVFVDADGQPIQPEEITRLGLWQLAPLPRPARRIDSALEQRVHQATEAARRQIPSSPNGTSVSLTVIWCKWVEGKLRFTIGEDSADLPFEGWTRTLRAPPYRCPMTGHHTYHLAGTHDGHVVDAGRGMSAAPSEPEGDDEGLVTCAATGLKVLPERTRRCPVSGETVLHEEMFVCRSCRQRVSPNTLQGGRCNACRQLHPISKSDPRLARVLDEYPPLDRFGHWRITETAEVYVLSCRRWLKRLVLVVDKESLELKQVVVGSRLLPRARVVDPAQFDYELKD